MFADIFELEFAYLRSRFSVINIHINKIKPKREFNKYLKILLKT